MTFEFPPGLILDLKSAHHVAVLTGAGTSAESGVPTFREAQSGLWSKYDPQELATPQPSAAILAWFGNGMLGVGPSWQKLSPMQVTMRWFKWLDLCLSSH